MGFGGCVEHRLQVDLDAVPVEKDDRIGKLMRLVQAKRLYQKDLMRVRREADKAAKLVPVPHTQNVINQLVAEYKTLQPNEQKIFCGLIGVEPIRKPRLSKGKS